MELNKEKKTKSEQAVLPNPCLEEEEEENIYRAFVTQGHTKLIMPYLSYSIL
jgi:hypothetical protein